MTALQEAAVCVNLSESRELADESGSEPALGFQTGWTANLGTWGEPPSRELSVFSIGEQCAGGLGNPLSVSLLIGGRNVDIGPCHES